MQLSELQQQVRDKAASMTEVDICLDLFKSELRDDAAVESMGVEAAAQKIVDDSMYWAGQYLMSM